MNVHVVCIDPPDRILARMAQSLVDGTGWTLGRKPDPNADINYCIPYLTARNHDVPFAAYFTHREDVLPKKVDIWERRAENALLRVTSARQYEQDLSQYGPTARIVPPLDREKFTPLRGKDQRERKRVGISGYAYAGGRKGEDLIADVLKRDVARRCDWVAAGKGWPIQSTLYSYEDLHRFYQALDVYVCPSLIEGVPYGPLEALACGVPVVIPRGVGLLDDLPDIGGIVRYEAGSADGLSLALETALTLTPRPNDLRAATEPFTVTAWVDGHVDAFTRLLNPEPMMTDRGIYIVAYGENARQCATRLLASIRRWLPGIPVAVCSDQPLPGADIWIEGDGSHRGRIAKTRIYDWAPAEWEYVWYLDADTEIVNDPSAMWQPLEQGAELLLHDGSPRNQIRHNMRPTNVSEVVETIKLIGSANARAVAGGVFAFRRSPNARAVFGRWRYEYERYCGTHDQPSLVRAVYSVPDARIHWIGSEWNRFTKYEKQGDYTIVRHWSGGPARITGDGVGMTAPYLKQKGMRRMQLRVTNRQRYRVGRRGYTFPPDETVELTGVHPSAYREIKASRYLDVEVVTGDVSDDAPVDDAPVTVPPIASPVVTKATLDDYTVIELRDLAEQHEVLIPHNTRKDDLIAILTEAGIEADD